MIAVIIAAIIMVTTITTGMTGTEVTDTATTRADIMGTGIIAVAGIPAISITGMESVTTIRIFTAVITIAVMGGTA